MTQGRDGISMARARALKLGGIARRLSLVAAMVAVAALVAGTAGTSYAKSKKSKVTQTGMAAGLGDTVVVSNYGAVFGGSLETFGAGAGHNAGPKFWIRGTHTNLSSSTGAGGDAQSSMPDNEVAVGIPIDFFDLTGCGPFGLPASAPAYGTGLVELFSPTATGNSAPENIICSPNFAFGAPDTTGIFYPQGVAFESPYDGVNGGSDILAVANMFPVVIGPEAGLGACAGGGTSLGTITEYNRLTLPVGLDNVPPLGGGFTVTAVNPFSNALYTQNATIGGCFSLLAGPTGVAFDQLGFLYVVNNAGFDAAALAAAPRYITVYSAGASGDAFPAALMGLFNETAGAVLQPVAATVLSGGIQSGEDPAPGLPNDYVFVTDTGDNSIKIFYPFENFDYTNFFYDGAQTGEIKGGNTKLKIPEGIALSPDGDALYVVNTNANSLEMFTDFSTTGEQDIPPTLIVQSPRSRMSNPVGVALPEFTPSPVPTCTVSGVRGDSVCD